LAAIKHTELFDFPAYQQALKEVKASTADFGKSVEGVIDRISKSQAELTAKFAEFSAQLKSMNVASPGAGNGLKGMAEQINQVSLASREYQATQASMADVLTLQKGSIKELESTFKSLKNQLASLKPTQADYAAQVGIIKGRLDLILPSLTAFNNAVKAQKQTIDFAEGSYKAMSAQMAALKAQLQAMPNAFNAVTGNLNKNNKEAVAIVQKIGTIDTALKAADASMGQYSRNVGNYTSAFSKGFGAIRQLAYILPGIGLAGIFNIIFEGIGKVVTEMGLFEGKTTEAQKAILALNKGLESDAYKNAIVNVSTLREDVELAKQGFISKEGVLKEYNDTIGKTTGQVDSLDKAEAALIKNGDAYVQMVLYKTAAQLSAAEAAKKMVEAAIKQQELEQNIARNATEQVKAAARGDKEGSGLAQFQDSYLRQQEAQLKKESEEAIKSASSIAEDFQKKAAEISKKFNFDFFGSGKKGGETPEDALKRAVDAQEKALKRSYDKRIKENDILLAQQEIDQQEFEKRKYALTVAYVQAAIAAELRLGKKASQDKIDGYRSLLDSLDVEREKHDAKQFAKLKAGTRANFDTVDPTSRSGAVSNTGKSTVGDAVEPGLKKQMDSELAAEKLLFETIAAGRDLDFRDELDHLERIKAIRVKYKQDTAEAEYAIKKLMVERERDLEKRRDQLIQDAVMTGFGIIQEQFDAGFDRRISKLDAEKQKELDNAGNNAAAKEKIEKAYNQRIAKEKRKQAVADKAAALVEVAVNTALAVSKELRIWGAALAGPFIAIDIATGLIQAAAIAAKPIPAFKEGTGHAPRGTAIVGEEGFELIERNGRITRTPDGPSITNLQGGEKIYTHEASKRLIEDSIKYQQMHDIIAVGNLQSKLALEIRRDSKAHEIQKMAEAMSAGGINKAVLTEAFEQAIKKIPIHQTIIDERGQLKRIQEINERRTYLNGR
jgi:hypothetical protein